jgi:hypothetical protein
MLIARRDKIGRAYLTRLIPVVAPALNASGALTFENIAERHGFATAPRQYTATWFTFDNISGQTAALGASDATTTRLAAPVALPASAGAYIRVDIAADHPDHPRWRTPVRAFFRRTAGAWTLVGLERLPDGQDAARPVVPRTAAR